ncbi:MULTISPECIES: acyl carrier protein [Paenibacillus]|uniref:acyl carrier protein n=1 Tax=Paenibacillus TaxID=44249 RepID=UPI0013ED171C|nr:MULTISPECIES: acyl carrier protein [Paenibacillus]KAF6578102.1 acyl carrier protein [Paenibacillus sp. EKM212P]MCP3780778.1 acyl carrier protein [Paenibacillus sp. MZ03-122A]MDY7989336.1 acyl carrier protein [Paenibacillus polymyxa]MDY8115995.1 acyl carrier protein [Paenibacillus polymyxa]URJ42675.1 acyl carrier protein [Paenibacillus polymyxa]
MHKEEVFDIVKRCIREVLPELQDHTFEYSDRLVDLGADSVDRAEIVNKTMETLSLNIPRVELSGVKNIGELTDALYAKL